MYKYKYLDRSDDDDDSFEDEYEDSLDSLVGF